MIDITTASGRPMFGILAALAELELIAKRTKAGIAVDVTPSFPPAGIRAGRFFCTSARLKQWAA
jgi:DNA invertase Pin-like site-specific DNA recombinase